MCNCPNRKKESAIVRPPFLSPTINARKKNSGPGYCAAIQRFQLANSKRGRERARTQSPRAISNIGNIRSGKRRKATQLRLRKCADLRATRSLMREAPSEDDFE